MLKIFKFYAYILSKLLISQVVSSLYNLQECLRSLKFHLPLFVYNFILKISIHKFYSAVVKMIMLHSFFLFG
jgi:hypothetical protein